MRQSRYVITHASKKLYIAVIFDGVQIQRHAEVTDLYVAGLCGQNIGAFQVAVLCKVRSFSNL